MTTHSQSVAEFEQHLHKSNLKEKILKDKN